MQKAKYVTCESMGNLVQSQARVWEVEQSHGNDLFARVVCDSIMH